MKNKSEVNIHNVQEGMKIKVALPRTWCQVNHTSPIVWMKGKITRIDYSKKDNSRISGICFNLKWNKHHHYFKIENMVAFPKEGVFANIYKIK